MKQQLLFFVLLSITFVLFGCGGVSTDVHNPPPTQPPPPAITIQFQSAPTGTLQLGQTTLFSAVVTNDPNNLGVDWLISCDRTDCGSFNTLPGAAGHSASGQAITYSAPIALSAAGESVTINAFATADHTKEVPSSPITITGIGNALNGIYVLETNGSDISGNAYQRVGAIVLDGNGGITSGEQTVNFVKPNSSAPTSVTDTVIGGSYVVGLDGHGTLTINTNDVDIGQSGVETFSLVVLSSSRALITKLDDPTLPGSNESSAGTMDLQNPDLVLPLPENNDPPLGFGFVVGGTDTGGSAMGLGGVLRVDSSLGILGAGSALDKANNSYAPGIMHSADTSSPASNFSGTVSADPTDPFGVLHINLFNVDFGDDPTGPKTLQFAAYPCGDGTHWKLIETDGMMGVTDGMGGFTVGDAFSQSTFLPGETTPTNNTGTFVDKTFFPGGAYVFGLFGRSVSKTNASLAAAGFFSGDQLRGRLPGYLDESQAGNSVQISDSFLAFYAVGPGSDPRITSDQSGTGRFYVPNVPNTGLPNFTFQGPSGKTYGTGPSWALYVTGNNGPILMLDADTEPSFLMGIGGGVATGIAYPAGASLGAGSFGAVFTQNLHGTETDAVAEISVMSDGSLSGIADINSPAGSVATNDNSLTGKFPPQPQPQSGANRITGTLSDGHFTTAVGNTTTLSMALYPILDSSEGFFVETDLAQISGQVVSGDLTFGRYFLRTPVCEIIQVVCP